MIQQQKQKLQEEELRLQQEKIRIQQEQHRQQEEIRQKQEELRQQQEQLLRNTHHPLVPQIQQGGMAPGPNQQNFQTHPAYQSGINADAPNAGIPDLSRPPPGFTNPAPAAPIPEIPRLPYYELPAGLMVPLVKVTLIAFFALAIL